MPDTVSYEKKHKTFVYRVAAVIVDHERVLLQRAEADHFWSLPGGIAVINEPAIDAIKREIWEELAVHVEVDRLLWVVENFFEDQKQDKQYHELSLYFLAYFNEIATHLAGNGPVEGSQTESNLRLIFQWFHRNDGELRNIPIYPLFLKYRLGNLPTETEHVVNQDRSR